MTESRFKVRLFWFLLGSKLLLVLYIFLFLKSGMTQSEFYASLALMSPLLAAYLVPLWKEMVANRKGLNKDSSKDNPLNKQFIQVCYIAFPLYVLIMAVILTQFVTGELFGGVSGTFDAKPVDRTGILAAYLAGVETAFGLYLGPVITALTRPIDKNLLHQKVFIQVLSGHADKALLTLDSQNEEWKQLAQQYQTQQQALEAGEIATDAVIKIEHKIFKALLGKLT